jgi:hypothetical protein
MLMAQYIGRLCEEGRSMVFSPKAHPLYSLWVAVEKRRKWREEELEYGEQVRLGDGMEM